MARQHDLDRGDAGWRDLAWASGAAAAVSLLLIASVGLVWMVGRSPSSAPVLAVETTSTPTPRALSFDRPTPTPAPTIPAEAPTATAGAEEASVDDSVASTPELLVLSGESALAPETDNGDATLFEAPGDADFTTLASGSWTASADALINDGDSAVAEPWLALTSVPDPAFALEAEIRVNGLLDTVCDQSFGLAGGSPGAGQMLGGGLLFPCDSQSARARLTDIAVWEDGYNADPVVAEESFDPGADWHTYRFELRGDRLRLVVDGVAIVSGAVTAAIDPAASDAQAGLWAQGVDLEVRKVVVYPLPPA